MDKRSPRNIWKNKPIFIKQTAIDGIKLFPKVDHYCRFLSKLESGKRRYGYWVLAYGMTPASIYLILIPKKDLLTNAMQSLFTSTAAKLRWASKHKGRVFSANFSSRPLTDEESLISAKKELLNAVRRESSVPLKKWPFVAVTYQDDPFKIISPTGQPRKHQKTSTLAPPFLTKNGLPTINWYLNLIESIQRQ